MELLGIEEVFSSLAIGMFTILLIAYAPWAPNWQKKSFVLYILEYSNNFKSNLSAVILLCISMGVGYIIQDLSDNIFPKKEIYISENIKFSPKKLIPNYILGFMPEFVLKREQDIKFDTLIEKEDNTYELTPLGKDIFSERCLIKRAIISNDEKSFINIPKNFNINKKNNLTEFEGALERLCPETVKTYDALTKQSRKCDNLTNILPEIQEQCKWLENTKKIINKLYYRAKNWAYLKPTYNKELSSIQYKIDFSRSICFLSTFFVFVYLFLFICFLLFRHVGFIPNFILKRCLGYKGSIILRIAICRMFRAIVILFLVTLLAGWHYLISEKNFNTRVFGYYLSYTNDFNLHNPGKTLCHNGLKLRIIDFEM